MDFKIKQLFYNDKPIIKEFLHKAYYPDDPVLKAMNIDDADEFQDNHLLALIDEGFSYAASDKDENILGVLLMSEINHNIQLLKFYNTLTEQSKLLEVSNLDKALKFHIAAVLPSARRKGLMRSLFLHGEKIALENNYKMVTCTCASQYTANLCQSLNWNCVYCLPYIYFKQNEEQIFKNPVNPHLYSRIYIRYL